MGSSGLQGNAGSIRGHDRVSILLAGRLWIEATVTDVRVRNISVGGVMLEMGTPPPPGTCVRFESAKTGTVDAVVAWTRGGRCGIAFTAPVHVDLTPRPLAAAALRPAVTEYKRPALRASATARAARSDDWNTD